VQHFHNRGARRRAPRLFLAAVLVASAALRLPGPAVAQEPALSAERRAAIEKLLRITNTLEQASAAAEQTASEGLDLMLKSRPGMPPRVVEVTKEVMVEELKRLIESPDGIMPAVIDTYGRHFTHDEILSLIVFYESDLGRKVAKTFPALLREITSIAQKTFQREQVRIQQLLQARLKAEGLLP